MPDAPIRSPARTRLIAAVAAAVLLSSVLSYLGVRWLRLRREAARRAEAILRAADAANDPLQATLLLLELRALPAPRGALETARRLVARPIPLTVLRGHQGATRVVRFTGDGAAFFTGGQDGALRGLRSDGAGATVVLRDHSGPIHAIAISPDGQRLLSASEDGTARLWGLAAAAAGGAAVPASPAILAHGGPVRAAAFTADGGRALTASLDQHVASWDVTTGRRWDTFEWSAGMIGVGHHAAGRGHVIGVSILNEVVVWPTERGEPVVFGRPVEVEAGLEPTLALAALSPDGARLAGAMPDGTVRLWKIDEPERSLALGQAGTTVRALIVQGARVAAGSADGQVRLWDADVSGIARPLARHQGAANALAFSPAGDRLASGGDDGQARTWELRAYGEVAAGPPLVGHGGPILSVSFAPDGRRVATASADGSARVWRLDEPEPPAGDLAATLAFMRARTTACLTGEERQALLGEAAAPAEAAFRVCEQANGRP